MPEVILVAGRGPMAARAIRSCRAAGAKVVAVHSEADANALHVRLADESVLIGEAAPETSYLNARAVVEAAQVSGAHAVLPVHSILAGSPELARATRDAGLLWIGADSETLTAVEDAGLWPGLAAESESPGWVIGLADGFRIDGLVVRRTRAGGACLCWTSAEEPSGVVIDGLPAAAQILAALSDRVVQLGWRGLVSVPFSSDGSALGVWGGVPTELGLVELRAGRDLIQAAMALADHSSQPSGSPGFPAAVGGCVRATAVPGDGRQTQLTEFTGPDGKDVRWDPGYATGDPVWPFYDTNLAAVAVPGDDLAGAIGAFLTATSSIKVVGLPCDLGQLRERAGEVAGWLSVDSH